MDSSTEVVITSLGGLGDGIAEYNGKPLFVAKSCVGDRLRVRIVHENHDGYQGVVTQVISSGPHRQIAPCVYFDRCGGCGLQQLITPQYREFKTRMLQSAMARAGYDNAVEVIFLEAATRRRVEFKISHETGKPLLAFFEPRSHTPVAIASCLILRPELQAMIAPINASLEGLEFASALFAVGLTLSDSGIDMMLTFKNYDLRELPPLGGLCKTLGLARISVRLKDEKPVFACAVSPVEMQLGNYRVALPADAFLQATSEGQKLLTDAVLTGVNGCVSVADLFCGIGTYSFPLAGQGKLHAVEGDEAMVVALQKSAKLYNIKGLSAEKRDLFKNPLTAKELGRFDGVVLNPPRIGAKAQCEQLAKSPVARVVMVSCNPASFARDAKILKSSGFTMESAQGIDQFVWSSHLEITAIFTR